jgi:hypothetical protein
MGLLFSGYAVMEMLMSVYKIATKVAPTPKATYNPIPL